jgi:uncharacterized protein YbjT (DUF2867 family)
LPLTGEEVLTLPEQVRILSEVVGTPIRCVDMSGEVAAQNMVRAGLPLQLAEMLARSFALIRDGRGSKQVDTVERVTGRRAVTFREWATQHKETFSDALNTVAAAR